MKKHLVMTLCVLCLAGFMAAFQPGTNESCDQPNILFNDGDPDKALEELKKPSSHWKAYAEIGQKQYKSRLLSKGGWVDRQEGNENALMDTENLPKEFHVAKNGSDDNPGSAREPFLTIQAAADMAQAGDVITVHEGIYRERVNPPRGGSSDERRIVYQAAPGEKVQIKGSELIRDWKRLEGDVWQVVLPNSYFGDFNPYSDTLHGHWFRPNGRTHHTGAVYLHRHWLSEAATMNELMQSPDNKPLWFGEVRDKYTTISAQFPGIDPNREEVEINVRQTVFFPEEQGLNYITVRGFNLSQAATPWAPPTTEQLGLIGPHWSKGWIIEDNTISYSICVGISLGLGEVNKRVTGNATGYTELINYVSENGLWSKEKIGGHVVRNNRISHCEQAGIAGSLGAAFSLIEGNEISEIFQDRRFSGLEQGGIKLHGATDVQIIGNMVTGTGEEARGIWLDWIGQGALVIRNIAFDNDNCDLFLEVNHGPILVANNIFLSKNSVVNVSRGTAFVHNLFGGAISICQTPRTTPFLEAHSTKVAGMHENYPDDDRFYNNIFTAKGKALTEGWDIDSEALENIYFKMKDNLYLSGALPHWSEPEPVVFENPIEKTRAFCKEEKVFLNWSIDPEWIKELSPKLITSEMLGLTKVSNTRFEQADGSPYRIDSDFFGNPRKESNPSPGPFEGACSQGQIFQIWPNHYINHK